MPIFPLTKRSRNFLKLEEAISIRQGQKIKDNAVFLPNKLSWFVQAVFWPPPKDKLLLLPIVDRLSKNREEEEEEENEQH